MHKMHNITDEEWKICLEYFSDSCAYCGMTLEDHLNKYKERLHREHVIHDGDNELSNCVPSCKICNSQKHTYTLEEWYNENNSKFTSDRMDRILTWMYYDSINIQAG